jgi:uncharacterized protein (TIGR03437 family)
MSSRKRGSVVFKAKSSAWALVVLFAAASLTANAQAGLSFSRRDVPSGTTASKMTAGDFNGDRKLDVALVTFTPTVSVLLGRGDGSFDTAREVIREPWATHWVVTADVNGDGRLDLISTHELAGVVSVALGRGDGTFAPTVQFPCGTGPVGLVAADVNGDGKLDLAVPNFSGPIPSQPGTTVSVLLGRGDGTFGAPISSPVLGQRPYSLAAGDFNRDGRADLVVTQNSPDVSILISKGDGTFQAPRAAAVPPGIYGAAAVADFNVDGRADIALLIWGINRLYVLLGNGDGSFQPSWNVAMDATSFVVADMNGDNVPDVVGVGAPYGVALVLVGRGDGNFEDQLPFQVAPGPLDLAVGDFNGDGTPDIVTCHERQTTLTVLLNTTPVPVISANGVVNAASFLPGPLTVSPGEIVTIFGRNLGPANLVTARLKTPELLDTVLDGTRVLFDGVAAPLIYVRADQISAVVPYGVTGKATTQLQVVYGSMRSAAVALRVVPTVPEIFTADSSGTGQVAAINEDHTYNSPARPAAKGSVITFFATGEGQTNPPGIDGKVAGVPLPSPALPVVVGIANIGSEIFYAGAAPGLVSGLLQINARVPLDAPSGPRVPLVIRIGDVYSHFGVTVAIE